MTDRYRALDVPVAGGTLRVGVWEADRPDAPTVLAVHGVTASHRSWALVAERLPGVRVVAPDLRGRGRSHPDSVPGAPTGMAGHAADLTAVLDHLGVDRALYVGHSMGAFVGVVTADLAPSRISRLLLVDGGLPLEVPAGLSADEVIAFVLGPTAERLAMRFESVGAYLHFWRQHPAFAADWSSWVEDYLAYDLVGEAPALRPATSYDAMATDTVDLNTGSALAGALERMSCPSLLLTAPRGLLDQVPGLYEEARLAAMIEALPAVTAREVEGVNHYTIVLSERGADSVAEAVLSELASL